jgi:myo-inositol-1(or 4)-monophosphatase
MLDFAIDIARRAGALLLEGLNSQRRIELKSAFEVVTDIDRASEQLIVSAIRAEFPGHAILAEESGGTVDNARPTWLIDPLDGTNNYAHGFPYFAVSLALWAEQQPLIGVVYDPLRDELFSASAGRGAHCNNQRLQVSQIATLGAALVSTGFPYDYASRTDNNLHEFNPIGISFFRPVAPAEI